MAGDLRWPHAVEQELGGVAGDRSNRGQEFASNKSSEARPGTGATVNRSSVAWPGRRE